MSGKAGIIGLGLIGGSIGIALREAGWHVVGQDVDQERENLGLEIGAID